MSRLFSLIFILVFLMAPNMRAQTDFALQTRQILELTKSSWVAIREYDGQDLIYFTHLLAWRCGLKSITYSLNDDTAEVPWPLSPCDEAAPNTLPDDQQIYTQAPLNSVASISIHLIYTDGTTDRETYPRAAIQIP